MSRRPLPVHPFPARMAPEIALNGCVKLKANSVVLDPMCGSGTTLRTALDQGLIAIGSDLDPLAVLISRVNTTPLDIEECLSAAHDVIYQANQTSNTSVKLSWVDSDKETSDFIAFWFAPQQIEQLRKIVYVINKVYADKEDLSNFLKVALSRIIITKEMKASLARDTSHSRPHRVARTNTYDCYQGFLISAQQLVKRIPQKLNGHKARVSIGDARVLSDIPDASVDAVITSPPYLNAIDYMRGNKLSLVWLGYKIKDLREVRGANIGAEKNINDQRHDHYLARTTEKMDFYEQLSGRQRGMFDRYILDIFEMMKETSRVLKDEGKAMLVVGNSCLKDVFIKNTEAVIAAAQECGLTFNKDETIERPLPDNRRYLPINHSTSLAKRMRTETILSFTK